MIAPRPVPIPPSWREATRADRLARMAAAMQRPDLAAEQLMRASRLLAEAAQAMTEAQREMAMEAVREVRAAVEGSGPTHCS